MNPQFEPYAWVLGTAAVLALGIKVYNLIAGVGTKTDTDKLATALSTEQQKLAATLVREKEGTAAVLADMTEKTANALAAMTARMAETLAIELRRVTEEQNKKLDDLMKMFLKEGEKTTEILVQTTETNGRVLAIEGRVDRLERHQDTARS